MDERKSLKLVQMYFGSSMFQAMRTAALVLYLLKHHRGPLDILKASVDIGGDVDSVAVLALRLRGLSPLDYINHMILHDMIYYIALYFINHIWSTYIYIICLYQFHIML